ncbi:MAG: hypothetical protein ACOCU8_03250 [Patescibacteria group bacterium]
MKILNRPSYDQEDLMIMGVALFIGFFIAMVVLVVNSDDRLPVVVHTFQGGESDPGLSGEVYRVIDTHTGEYHSREWYLENCDHVRIVDVVWVAPPHMREGWEDPRPPDW